MSRVKIALMISTVSVFLTSCATVGKSRNKTELSADAKSKILSVDQSIPKGKRYKRKIAILRFSNETNYGRALLSSADYDRIGKQTSDMLASRLIESNEFLVFERSDLTKLMEEKRTSGSKSELIGVDTVISGALTEFGRSTDGQSGFLSSTKMQTAQARVDARLIDLNTGHAFFSAKGVGKATNESGEVAGFGSRSEYDATLNDRAIGAAISNMISEMISKIKERKWRTDILDVQGKTVFISGGKSQGLQVGDLLKVMKPGKVIKSGQSGFDVNLPPTEIATMKIISLFGENETNEGAVCELQSNAKIDLKTMYVVGGDE